MTPDDWKLLQTRFDALVRQRSIEWSACDDIIFNVAYQWWLLQGRPSVDSA